MTVDPQSSTGEFEYVVTDERGSVLNWAVAVEGRVREAVTAYVGYGTDFSSDDGSESNLVVAPWDIRTVSVGADFRIRGRSLTLGGAYGWGGVPSRDVTDSVPADDLDPPLGLQPGPVRYRSIRIILGFEF